jgi:HEAT repeat protein
MRKLLLGLVALALGLANPVSLKTAYAHGGQYRGPAGEVPPDSRQPEDPPPPDTGGGTPTPPDSGGGTPTPPDGGGGTPTPPDSGGGGDTGGTPPSGGGSMPPPSGPSGGTTTGKKPGKKGPSYESWLFWWNYNKDEIVNIKARIRSGQAVSTATTSGITIEGASRGEAEAQNVTAQAIETQVVPVLKQFARDSKVNFDIQSAAVLALAKIRREEEIAFIMSLVKNADGKTHKVVEESAALALGIMQSRTPEVRKFLLEVARDTEAKTRTRAFSMFALGLLGDDTGVTGANSETLEGLKALVQSKEASRDIANSALVAIGLLGDRAAVPDLVKWLTEEKAGSEKLNDLNTSYAAAALGKIGQPGISGPSSTEVFEALKAQVNKKTRMTRYASVIALGQIAPQGDEKLQKEVVSILASVVKGDSKAADQQTVNFALIGLGRIAGVKASDDGSGGCPAAVRERAIDTLKKAFDDSRSRNFAALGLGLAAMEQDTAFKAPIAEQIRNTLAREKGDNEARGALAISLGMLRDRVSVPLLQGILDGKDDVKLRGTAAVALGLIGEKGSLESIRKALAEKEDRELRVDAAIAAGLLSDKNAVKSLAEILRDPKSSQFVLGSVAMALGQIGDERAVEPLKEILHNQGGEYPDLTRALAAVALGQIGDVNDIPVLNRVSRDVNYRAYYDAIGELLTII